MFSQEDSLASLSVMPASEKAMRMTAISGRKCSVLLPKSGQLGLLVKMLLASQRWQSKARFLKWDVRNLYSEKVTDYTTTDRDKSSPSSECAETLKVQDIQCSRLLFRLVPLEPHTEGTESSLLLKTPCQADSYTDKMKSQGISGTSGTLAQEIVNGYARKNRGLILPTPNASEGEKYTNTYNPKSQMGKSLSAMAGSMMLPTQMGSDCKKRGPNSKQKGVAEVISEKLLPTPRASSAMSASIDNAADVKRFPNLETVVARLLLPTPAARDHKQDIVDGKLAARAEKHQVGMGETIAQMVVSQGLEGGQTSRLSPLFTEEMMGFPLMWTASPYLSASGEQKA